MAAAVSQAVTFDRRGHRLIECRLPVPDSSQTVREVWSRCASDPAGVENWETLLNRLHPLLWRVAKRVAGHWGLRSNDDIVDLIQDICLKFNQQFKAILTGIPEDDHAAERYLAAVATNAARDSMRSRFAAKRSMAFTVTIEDHLPSLAGALGVLAVERGLLVRKLESLVEGCDRDRAVFWLYYRQGWTAKEIAAIPTLSLTDKGVESLLRRMVESIRKKLPGNSARGAAV